MQDGFSSSKGMAPGVFAGWKGQMDSLTTEHTHGTGHMISKMLTPALKKKKKLFPAKGQGKTDFMAFPSRVHRKPLCPYGVCVCVRNQNEERWYS